MILIICLFLCFVVVVVVLTGRKRFMYSHTKRLFFFQFSCDFHKTSKPTELHWSLTPIIASVSKVTLTFYLKYARPCFHLVTYTPEKHAESWKNTKEAWVKEQRESYCLLCSLEEGHIWGKGRLSAIKSCSVQECVAQTCNRGSKLQNERTHKKIAKHL